MAMQQNKESIMVSYDKLEPGFEAVYIDKKPEDTGGAMFIKDESGRLMRKWSLWNSQDNPEEWGPAVNYLNKVQKELGRIPDDIRKIRAHIASFTSCDSGLPVTVDEILAAIGSGRLIEPAFKNGCWNPGLFSRLKSSQPDQVKCLRIIYQILNGYLKDVPAKEFQDKLPFARDFIAHVYEWLGPVSGLTKLKKLLFKRMLMPFELFTIASTADPRSSWSNEAEKACKNVFKNCFEPGGRGTEIDREIAASEGLPEIKMMYPESAYRAEIDDPGKKDLYVLCCSLAHGLHTICDCHHSAFRWIENWIYAIGTGKWGIPTRKKGTEKERTDHLLAGYALALNKWLLGIPMQFLLLELGHKDIGFDPKNEIVRVYAYLGAEKTQVKAWLAACLWYNLMYATGGLAWNNKNQDLLKILNENGINIREWIDSQLNKDNE
jgi:hypothetical protein